MLMVVCRMSPEVKNGTTYGFPADVYSLGVIVFELLEYTLPEFDAMVSPLPRLLPPAITNSSFQTQTIFFKTLNFLVRVVTRRVCSACLCNV